MSGSLQAHARKGREGKGVGREQNTGSLSTHLQSCYRTLADASKAESTC